MLCRLEPLRSGRDTEIDMIEREMEGGVVIIQPMEVHEHAVERHLQLWQQIIDQHKQNGSESLYITPEFGPPAYMHTAPFTNQPVGDVWEQNVYMKELLVSTLEA